MLRWAMAVWAATLSSACVVEDSVLTPISSAEDGINATGATTGEPVTSSGNVAMSTSSGDDSSGGVTSACDPALVGLCPEPGVTWQYQLQGAIDETIDADVFVIDLFDSGVDDIAALHGLGRAVVCFVGAGTFEGWRPDADVFPPASIGNPLLGYDDEFWLDHRDPAVREALEARMDLASDKGCDGLEPANLEAYLHDSGFDVSADDQLAFNRWVAETAHARGLSVGLSGDRPHVPDLWPTFDWALNAGCLAAGSCADFSPFTEAAKAVLVVEYAENEAAGPALAQQVCPQAAAQSLSAIIKLGDLGAWRLSC